MLAQQSFSQQVLNSKGLKMEDTDDQDNNGFVETSEDYPNENKPVFILRESAPSLVFWQKHKGRQRTGKL